MNTKELSRFLRDDARLQKTKLCDEWYRQWDLNGDKQYLINLYLKGIDFAIANDWPDLDFVKKNFEKELLRKNSILVDDSFSILNKSIVVLLGNSVGKIRNSGWNICTCYVCHNSIAEITVRNMSYTTIHAFGNATIKIRTEDKATAVVILHSDNAKIDAPDKVKIRKDETSYK